MYVKYEILQTDAKYVFGCYNYAKRKGLSLKDYKKVYADVIKVGDGSDLGAVAEIIYMKYNCELPQDYTGRSVSVSDILILNGEYYYCDRFGFKKLNVDIIV